MQIVDRIKSKCKEEKTTIAALERELGFGNGTIRMWDTKTPGADKVIIMANRLGCSLDWLLTGKEAGELTPEEQKLVDYYRNTNPTGQSLTMQTAKANSEALPAEPEQRKEHPAGVSTSATG